MGIRTIYLLQCVFLLVFPSMGGKAVLRGGISAPESVVADSTTNLEADPPTIISYSPAPRSYLRTVGSPADAVKMALAAQAAAEKRMVDGAHCKIQWKWTVSKDQQNSTVSSLSDTRCKPSEIVKMVMNSNCGCLFLNAALLSLPPTCLPGWEPGCDYGPRRSRATKRRSNHSSFP
jgi:hypothetical protein